MGLSREQQPNGQYFLAFVGLEATTVKLRLMGLAEMEHSLEEGCHLLYEVNLARPGREQPKPRR